MPKRPTIQDICARVARTIERERLARDLSMTRLAEGAGLSRQMISYVERGKRIPTLDTLLRIVRVLGIDLADVISAAERQD